MKRVLPLLLLPALANATTLIVTSTGDDAADPATLRGAIAAAADGDTIAFDALLAGATIALAKANGPLEYSGSLTIDGGTGAPVTIDGGAGATESGVPYADNNFRTIPLLRATGTAATTTLRNLVFTGSKTTQAKDTPDVGPVVSILGNAVIDNCTWTLNGVARSGNFGSNDGGGCLRVAGDLTLSSSTFSKNAAKGAGGNFVIGGAVCAKGANVLVTNCVFSETYGWGGSHGNANDLGALGLATTVASATVVDTLFEKNAAGHGPGGIYIAGGGASSRYAVRRCAFRENYGANSSIRHGAAMCMGNQGNLVVEDTEFALGRANYWGPALRVDNENSKVVFVNCTMACNTGNEWGGGAVDTRCDTWYVNCTAAGNVNRHSDVRGSTFFVWKTVNVLNSAVVWNYYKNGAELNDISRFQGTLKAYNSYFHTAGNGPQTKVDVRDYDADTKLFAEPFETYSSFTVFGSTITFSSAISSPVLASDPALPALPRVAAIDKAGVLFRTGWPVKHDANWENIAYSQDGGSTWTALRGSADAATIPLAADSRGAAYPVESGVPLPPIGSATVPLRTVSWDVGTNGGSMQAGGATVTTAFETLVVDGDAPVVPGTPTKADCNFVGWNTDPGATAALDLSALSIVADTTLYAIFRDAAASAVVNWFDEDGTTLLSTTSVDAGDRPAHADPEKAPDVQHVYPFAGWIDMDVPGATPVAIADLPPVVGGTTVNYKAAYASAPRAYDVVFEDWDGTVLQSGSLDYGSAIVAPADPSRASTVDYSYAFAGWSPALASGDTATGAVVYAAVYTETENSVLVDPAGYEHRLTFTVGGYDGTETLESFPVLVRLSTALVKADGTSSGFSFADFAAGGSDLRFVLGDGTAPAPLLIHEIDTWDATGESLVWVSLPSVANGTTFTMLWSPEEGTAEPAPFTPSRIWTKAGYLGVWHFNAAEGGAYADAAGGGHDAVPTAAATEYAAGGAVGGYVRPAEGGMFVADSADWVDFVTNVTAELWLNRDDGGQGWLFSSGGDNMINQGAAIRMDGYIIGNGHHTSQRPNYVPADGWHHLAVNFRKGGSLVVVVDGETPVSFWHGGGTSIDGNSSAFYHNAEDTQYMNETYRSFSRLSLVSRGDGQGSYTSFADEFRFRAGGSSTDWIQASWDTSVAGSTFLSNGGVVSTGASKIDGMLAVPSWTQATVTGIFTVQAGSEPFAATLSCNGVSRTAVVSDAASAFTTVFTNLLPGTTYTATLSATIGGTAVSTNATFTTLALPAPAVDAPLGTGAGTAALDAAFSTEASDFTVRADFVPAAEGGTAVSAVAADDGTGAVSAAVLGLDRDAEYTAYFRILAADGTTVVASTEGVSFMVGGYQAIDGRSFYQEWTFTVTNHIAENGKAALDEVNYLPVPLRLSEGAPAAFTPRRYAGGALLRAMQDGQTLPIEVESWDPEGESVVWVGVPVVTNGAAFSLLAAPKSGAAVPDARPARLWTRAGYVGVWHLATTNSAGVFEDSSGVLGPTRDAFDGVFTNGVVGGGIVGNGRLVVSNDVATSYAFATGVASEMWVVPTSSDGHGRPFSSMASGTSGYGWSVKPDSYYAPSFNGTSWSNAQNGRNWSQSDPPAPRHLSSSTGSVFLLFTDGSQRSSWNMSSYASPSFPRGIGLLSYTSGNNYMNGLADELRVRARESSAAWHRANYLAMSPDVPYLGVALARDFPPATMMLFK